MNAAEYRPCIGPLKQYPGARKHHSLIIGSDFTFQEIIEFTLYVFDPDTNIQSPTIPLDFIIDECGNGIRPACIEGLLGPVLDSIEYEATGHHLIAALTMIALDVVVVETNARR